jgi:serine/threonine protein kinase
MSLQGSSNDGVIGSRSAAVDTDREMRLEEATLCFFQAFEGMAGTPLCDKILNLVNVCPKPSDVLKVGLELVEEAAEDIFGQHGFCFKEFKTHMKKNEEHKVRYEYWCKNGPVARARRKKEEIMKIQELFEGNFDVRDKIQRDDHVNWLITTHAIRHSCLCLQKLVEIVANALHHTIQRTVKNMNSALVLANQKSPPVYDETLTAHSSWMANILAYHTLDVTKRKVYYGNCRANLLSESPLHMIKLFCSQCSQSIGFEQFESTIIFNILRYCKEFYELTCCIDNDASRERIQTLLDSFRPGCGADVLDALARDITTFRNLVAHEFTISQAIPQVEWHQNMEFLTNMCHYAVEVAQEVPPQFFGLQDPDVKSHVITFMRSQLTQLQTTLRDKESFKKSLTAERYRQELEDSIDLAEQMKQEIDQLKLANLTLKLQLEGASALLQNRHLFLPRIRIGDLKLSQAVQHAAGASGIVANVTHNTFRLKFKQYNAESVALWKNEIPAIVRVNSFPSIVRVYWIVVSDRSDIVQKTSGSHSDTEDARVEAVANPEIFEPVGYLMEPMFASLGDPQCAALSRKNQLRLMQQVARGLEYCHGQHVVHGDIKPENILVNDAFDLAKICDFGTAKIKHPYRDTRSLTHSSAMLKGTWYFIAPEHLNDFSTLDYLCDIYSFGMTLWRIFHQDVAQSQIQKIFSTNFDVLRKQVQDNVRPPMGTKIPPKLSSLIQRCWDNDRAMRPQSMSEICYELDQISLDSESDIPLPVLVTESDFASQYLNAASPKHVSVADVAPLIHVSVADADSPKDISVSGFQAEFSSLLVHDSNPSSHSGDSTPPGLVEFAEETDDWASVCARRNAKTKTKTKGRSKENVDIEFHSSAVGGGALPAAGSPQRLISPQPAAKRTPQQLLLFFQSHRSALVASYPTIVSFIYKQIEFKPDDLEATFQFWIQNRIEFPWWFAAYYKTCEEMVLKHRSELGFPCTKFNHQAGWGCNNASQRTFELPGCVTPDARKTFNHYCILCGFKGKNNPEPQHMNHGAFTGYNRYHCPFQRRYNMELEMLQTSTFKLSEEDIFIIIFESIKDKYRGRSLDISKLSWLTGPMNLSQCRGWWEKQDKRDARADRRLQMEEESAAFWS